MKWTHSNPIPGHNQGSRFHEERKGRAVSDVWEGFFRSGDVVNLRGNDLSVIG